MRGAGEGRNVPLGQGSRIGPYEIVSLLGAGGMGRVYRARDPRLGRDVAIKVLPEDAARDRERLERFSNEARTVAALNHPNILTLHEIGESPDGPYLVTELVEGRSIREMLATGPLPVAQSLDLALQTATGLARAHAAGIVHRDIKPDNLMVSADGFVKILDFGLAKLLRGDAAGLDSATHRDLTASGMVVGSPAYLAPEQLREQPIDARADLFALGIVLYEMLTGKNPFRRDTAAETLHAILSADSAALVRSSPGLPAAVQEILRRALMSTPEARFSNSSEMVQALRPLVHASQTTILRPRRRAAVVPVAAASILVVVILLVFALPRLRVPGTDATHSTAPAEPANLLGEDIAAPTMVPRDRIGVAVLPIRDASAAPELNQAGIGRILGNAFVQMLTGRKDLYVISPQRLESIAMSMQRSVDEAADDATFGREIATRAQAGAVLSGTLSRLGNTYILNATLTGIPSEVVLQDFSSKAQSLETILDELTRDMALDMLPPPSDPSTPHPPAPPMPPAPTRSLDAYAHYIRGDDLVQEGDWQAAIPELEKAVTNDPQMALAWSSLSCAHSFSGDDSRARAAHLKAREYDDHLNEHERRWIELDGIWVNTGNGKLYLDALERFIRDFPDDRDSYFYGGLAHEYLLNDPSTAIEWYEKAYAMVPVYYPVTKALVDCELKLDQKQRAIASLQRYLALPQLGKHGKEQATWRLAELEGRS